MEVLLFMKNYIKSLLIALFVSGSLIGYAPMTQAMQDAQNQTLKEKINHVLASIPKEKIAEFAQNAATIFAIDTVMNATGSIVEDENSKTLMSMSLGMLMLVGTKITTKYHEGINSIKEIVPEEILSSQFTKKPVLCSLLAAAGFLHMYADELGISPHYLYLIVLGLKLNLFNNYKEAIAYNITSGLYSLGCKFCFTVPGADTLKDYFSQCKSFISK